MLEGFKTTTKERAAIAGAWEWLIANTRDEYRSKNFLKDEKNGYGNPNDRVPEIAAKGMCLSWFLRGVQSPDALLRDWYFCRPAAIWFAGMGTERSGNAAINMTALQAAAEAYEAAFARMTAKDRQSLSMALQPLLDLPDGDYRMGEDGK
jgi:hypothetical protein